MLMSSGSLSSHAYRFSIPFSFSILHEHRDDYLEVSAAILILNGIGVLCSSLRDQYPAIGMII